MTIKKHAICLENLDPIFGAKAGKTRPVLVIQSDLLNKFHPSTLICPNTTNVKSESKILRVQLTKGVAGVNEDCDVMIDQIRAIDNKRLLKRIGSLPAELSNMVKENLKIVFELEY